MTPRPVPITMPAYRRRQCRGMGLIEIMVSLTITASLLVAVATAWTSSANAVEHNEEHFRASQAARVTMTQVLAEIRRCAGIHNGSFAGGLTTSNLRLITAAVETPTGDRPGRDLEWSFTPANTAFTNPLDGVVSTTDYGRLLLINRTDNKLYTIARNVESISFTAALGTNDAGTANVPVTVTVKMVTVAGGNSVTTTGSAAPRYNMVY